MRTISTLAVRTVARCMVLLASVPCAWAEVTVDPPGTITLRPRQDFAYAVISLENRLNATVAIKRILLSSSLNITAEPKDIDHVGPIQVRPREQFQLCLEVERQPNMPYYINTYVIEVMSGDGTLSQATFSLQVDQLWPWRGHASALYWDQSVGENGAKQMVLELDDGYTAELDPKPTTEIAVTGVAEGNRYTVTVTPTVELGVMFNERARLLVRGPDGSVHRVSTQCFRTDRVKH